MATVLEDYTIEEQRSVELFFFVGKMAQSKGYSLCFLLRWEVFVA
jgi:hypothetical protein